MGANRPGQPLRDLRHRGLARFSTNRKVYHAVVAQLADDEKFTQNVRTLFNNDHKNLDNLGVGTNREYFESHEGKLIEGKGAAARYVRLYSDGSTVARLNEYTEIEVYGRLAK